MGWRVVIDCETKDEAEDLVFELGDAVIFGHVEFRG